MWNLSVNLVCSLISEFLGALDSTWLSNVIVLMRPKVLLAADFKAFTQTSFWERGQRLPAEMSVMMLGASFVGQLVVRMFRVSSATISVGRL